MPIYNIFLYVGVGMILLAAGRELFWIFVGACGFLAGFSFAQNVFADQSYALMLAAGIICALVGMCLALVFQRLAIILAGAVAGGMIAVDWVNILMTSQPIEFNTGVFILGALVGGIFMALAFDMALIVISSLLGAGLIVSIFWVDLTIKLLIMFFLVMAGIFLQTSLLHPPASKRELKNKSVLS